MNKLNTKLLIGYILLGALIIAVAREYGFFAFVILVGFLVFVLYRKKKNAADKSDQMPYLTNYGRLTYVMILRRFLKLCLKS